MKELQLHSRMILYLLAIVVSYSYFCGAACAAEINVC